MSILIAEKEAGHTRLKISTWAWQKVVAAVMREGHYLDMVEMLMWLINELCEAREKQGGDLLDEMEERIEADAGNDQKALWNKLKHLQN